MNDRRVLCIVGPTASGKTRLSIELAKRLSGEIVSADSRQVYRRMDIGTAKPSLAEREGIPHFGLDLFDIRGHAHYGQADVKMERHVMLLFHLLGIFAHLP